VGAELEENVSIDPRTPVIVGVGQHLQRTDRGEEPLEPVDLMELALRAAADDAGSGDLPGLAQVVAVVPVISWGYRDPGRLLADRLGSSATTWYPAMGGNTPQMLVNRLCRSIAEGQADVGVVVGGESYRSRMAAKRADEQLDWTRQSDDVRADWNEDGRFSFGHPAELALGIAMPTQAYPVFETALWHDSGRSLEEHLRAIGELWAGFARVAADNPYAWRREAPSAEELTTPSAENRLVGFPYTKRMVANPDVDMAAGCIVCSVDRARALGIDEDRWVFPHAGTDGVDRVMSERVDLVSSPAIGVAGNRALELAGVTVEEVDHVDLYSCFPSAVQLACRELGIDPGRQLTVYGGLPFAGGPWNNPVSHAIATMVRVLREDPGSTGLVTANGGNVDKHAFGVYSTAPPADGFRWEHPQEQIDAAGRRSVLETHDGPCSVEGWTVVHERDGSRSRAHAACLTPGGDRVWGVSHDPDLMELLETTDVGGRPALLAGNELRLSD
jgi:acetyl-CoA C-acetyltransferase